LEVGVTGHGFSTSDFVGSQMKIIIKAGIAKYKEIVSSLFGKDMKDVAGESLTDKYPKAKGLGVGDIGGLEEETGLIAAIARDGTFIAYDNGTVKDTKTGFMWASKDNGEDINWKDAKRYCENYRGGGYTDWRMPTQNELTGLYDQSESYQVKPENRNVYLTKLIQLTTGWLWASKTRGSKAAFFSFGYWGRFGYYPSDSNVRRVLPVRGGN